MLARDPDVEDLLQPAVKVRVHVVAGPLEAEGVEALGEVGAADLASGGGAPEGVEVGGGAWGGLVVVFGGDGGGIETNPSGLCWYRCRGRQGGSWDRCRGLLRCQSLRCEASHRIRRPVGQACDVISNEAPVSDVRLDSPECGPEPISRGHLCSDLHLPVPDSLLPLGVETRGAHGGDGVAKRVVAVDHAVERGGGCAAAVGGEVHGEAIGDLLVGDGSGLVGESRDDVQALGIDERVLGG